MHYNWYKLEQVDIRSLMLWDCWMIKMVLEHYARDEFLDDLSKLFHRYPDILWAWKMKAPEVSVELERIDRRVTSYNDDELIQVVDRLKSELETTIIYTYPELMEQCDYIINWEEDYLVELADFNDKVVLDIGSGTGRLAFAAAKSASMVYASEPTTFLREYISQKAKAQSVHNIRAVDGYVDELPFEDDTFDIVMSGHVVGDDLEAELKEMTRVLKSGGWIIDCIGEDGGKRSVRKELTDRGFESFYHKSVLGGDIYRYRKRVFK